MRRPLMRRALTWALAVVMVVEMVALLVGPRRPTGPAWARFTRECARAGGEPTLLGESWVCLLTHPQPERRELL